MDNKYSSCGPHLKARILNIYLMSTLWYSLQVLDPPAQFLENITKLCIKFLWGNGKHWVKELFVFSPREQGGLGVKNPLDQLQIFRFRLFGKMLTNDFNEYLLQNVADNMLKHVVGYEKPSSAFYRNIQEHMVSWKLVPACIPPAQINKWPISIIFLSPEEVSVLKSHKIQQMGTLTNSDELTAIVGAAPSHKRRCLERNVATAKEKTAQFQHNPKMEQPHFQAYDTLSEKRDVITTQNSYKICYWRRMFPTCSEADLTRAKSAIWKPLKLSLSPRELDISWRVKHGAISTPQMAYRMGLRPNYSCFFCDAYRPNWRHLLVCPHYDQMWALIEAVAVRSGAKWSRNRIFSGFPLGECGIINHTIHAGYLVVHVSITLVMNSVNCHLDPVKRWKQILFDMIYCDFKHKCHDETTTLRFKIYWRKLDFLFKTCGRSIDIRIPSSFNSFDPG